MSLVLRMAILVAFLRPSVPSILMSWGEWQQPDPKGARGGDSAVGLLDDVRTLIAGRLHGMPREEGGELLGDAKQWSGPNATLAACWGGAARWPCGG